MSGRVKLGHSAMSAPGPDYPRKQPYAGHRWTSQSARLRDQAAVEDVDYRSARGLDRALFQKLAEGAWIDAHENLILCGPIGVGKSWLASRHHRRGPRTDKNSTARDRP